jgi:hypothetical protein
MQHCASTSSPPTYGSRASSRPISTSSTPASSTKSPASNGPTASTPHPHTSDTAAACRRMHSARGPASGSRTRRGHRGTQRHRGPAGWDQRHPPPWPQGRDKRPEEVGAAVVRNRCPRRQCCCRLLLHPHHRPLGYAVQHGMKMHQLRVRTPLPTAPTLRRDRRPSSLRPHLAPCG